MNHRERSLNTFQFKRTDKFPLERSDARESTLARWHKEGLPNVDDWYTYCLSILGIQMSGPDDPSYHFIEVNTRMIPTFEEKVISHENGHYIIQDWMGAITEISDQYDYTYIRGAKDFVTRRWHKFPVETHEDWVEMKKRYNPDDIRRYPANAAELPALLAGREYLSSLMIGGIFWQLRDWLGFENLCVAFIDQLDFVTEMIDFWSDFILRVIEKTTSQIPVDHLYINEDMAYKAHPMISPQLVREYFLPVYQKWAAAAKKNGARLIEIDSDGYIGDLIPIWIDMGITICGPIEVAAHNDIAHYLKEYGTSMAYRGGIDKRAIAAGGKIMEAEVRRVVEPFLENGGLVPGCDHAVPADVSYQNFLDYTRFLAELTGWK